MGVIETTRKVRELTDRCDPIPIVMETKLIESPAHYEYRFRVFDYPAHEDLIGGTFVAVWLTQAEADEFLRVFHLAVCARGYAEGMYRATLAKAAERAAP